MRIGIVIAVCVILAFAGEWIYRSFLRPVDPLTPDVLALAEHFNDSGIKVRPYAVRHGFRHSQVLAAAALKIEGFPIPVGITVYPSEEIAIERLEVLRRDANPRRPARNGRLVMDLLMWGNDTDEMAAKVTELFTSFADSTR